jgi:hypothetical protein
MKKLPGLLLASIVVLAFLAVPTFAQPVRTLQNRRNNNLPVATPLPKISVGERVEISEPISRDLIVTGGQILVNTTVDGDVIAAGGQVEIAGKVEGNLMVAGGQVEVNADVMGDVISAGGRVRIGENTTIGGYLIGGGGQVEMLGQVTGSAQLSGGTVDVRPTASIGGNLHVDSGESTISDTAQIGGEKIVSKTPRVPRPERDQKPLLGKTLDGNRLGGALFGFSSQLLVLLAALYFFGRHVKQLAEYAFKAPLSMMGWGLLKLVVTPIAVVLLLITIIGAPLGVIVGLAYAVKLYLAKLVVAVCLGRWIDQKGWVKTKNQYAQATAGLLALSVLMFLPVIGGLTKVVALLIGLGAFLSYDRATWLKIPRRK